MKWPRIDLKESPQPFLSFNMGTALLYQKQQGTYSTDMRKIEKKHGQKVHFQVNGSLNVAIFKEGRSYIAYAPALDLAAQGKSVKDVQKNFEDIFDIYLEETMTKGTLEKDLLRCGWNKQAGKMQPPTFSKFPESERIGKDIELTALAVIPLNNRRSCPA